jgi:HAD superfamily hydrolase (TIGR01509 family)
MHIASHIQGLIFDCDGTLANTIPSHLKAYQDVLQSYGLKVPNTFLLQYNGYPDVEIMAKVKEAYGAGFDPVEAAHQKETVFLEKYLDQVEPIEVVMAIMRQYHGRLPIAVATGGVRHRTLRVLKAIGATDLFDTLVSVEDVSRGKPEPDLFLEAAKRIKVQAANCLVFEDADSGLEAARRAGMEVMDIRTLVGDALLKPYLEEVPG